MLNLYKLEIFERVVEDGSFSGAAERLLMSQSGVSQHIQDLETTLGTKLFIRGRRGVKLTRSGRTLHDYAHRIFTLVGQAENAVTDVANLPSGQVNIGATPGVSIYLLANWIQSFRSRYPKLTVTLRTSITPMIVTALLAQQMDIGIIEGELNDVTTARLGVLPLQTISQHVVVGKTHPFWGRKEVSIRELDGQMFIMRQPGSQTRIWLDEMLLQHRVRPLVGAEFDSMEAIKRAVSAGNAVTILPEYAVQDEQSYGTLQAILIQHDPLQRILKLIWDKRRYFTPVTRSLLIHLQGCFPALENFNMLELEDTQNDD